MPPLNSLLLALVLVLGVVRVRAEMRASSQRSCERASRITCASTI